MVIVFIRTILLYLIIIVAMRLMGKRQIGELQPSELVVTMMISELATLPVQATNFPITAALVPILTLVVLEIITSFVALHNSTAHKFVSGTPSIIIENGVVDVDEMEKIRMSRADLAEELRLAGVPEIEKVKLAIVETNGKLSVQEMNSIWQNWFKKKPPKAKM